LVASQHCGLGQPGIDTDKRCVGGARSWLARLLPEETLHLFFHMSFWKRHERMPLTCVHLRPGGCWPWWLNWEEVVRRVGARILFEERLSSYRGFDKVANLSFTWKTAESWRESLVNVPGRYFRSFQADGSQRGGSDQAFLCVACVVERQLADFIST